MKLRNLLFGTMIACAFVGCSNDDDPIDNGGGGNETPDAEATLEVKVATPALTKADGVTDKTITSLAVLVFDKATAKLESKGVHTVGTTDGNAGKAGDANSVIAEKITAGAKQVLVLANVADKVNGYTKGIAYSTVLADTNDFSDAEKDGTLSMNSGVYEVDIQAGITNYLGYTSSEVDGFNGHYLDAASGNAVKLYRNVAKIVLESVQVTANTAKYKNAALEIEDLFILHASKSTKLVGNDGKPWGTTISTPYNYFNGVSNDGYTGWAEYMKTLPADAIVQQYLASDAGTFSYSDLFVSGLTTTENLTVANTSTPWEPTSNNSFYAYENTSTEIYTLLVVKGKFKYGDVQNPESRYYSVAIGKDGIAGLNNGTYPAPDGFDGSRTEPLSGTVRNLQYNVALKVAGPGYTTPFGPKADEDTFLDVKVEVVNFGTISQSTEIE